MANSFKPMLESLNFRTKQIGVVNTDVLNRAVLAQSNLSSISAQLAKGFDFGQTNAFAKTLKAFSDSQAHWLQSLKPTLTSFGNAFYPPNLRGIEGLTFESVETVVMVDGIPLYGVPRRDIAGALIRAENLSARRVILGRRWEAIVADCRIAIKAMTSPASEPFRDPALAAIKALECGHPEAAQALAGSLVDAIVTSYFGKDRVKYTPNRKGTRTKDAYEEFNVREFFAFAPMWQAYQQFFVVEGDKIPHTFSRNATAHTVSPRQFNRRNAVQALMLVTSLLYRLDEEIR
ncbi:hypothetical protein GCM10009737_32490 [Nocardioides lentus]|uniref:Uncharacterized protein n=1 Tax=Nocardioides lentus TaxID=338077 RepID=A0ABP5B0P1_9ACTN